jgi:hypothetical protein
MKFTSCCKRMMPYIKCLSTCKSSAFSCISSMQVQMHDYILHVLLAPHIKFVITVIFSHIDKLSLFRIITCSSICVFIGFILVTFCFLLKSANLFIGRSDLPVYHYYKSILLVLVVYGKEMSTDKVN